MAIDWSIIRSNGPVDVASNFATGFKMGRAIVDDAHQRSALAAYAAHPGDPSALSALYQVNPELASRLEETDQKRADYNREGEARGALADVILGQNGLPQPRGLTGAVPNALTGQIPQEAVQSAAPEPAPVASPVTQPSTQAANGDITVTAQRQPHLTEDGLIRQPQMSDAWQRYVRNDPAGAMKFMIDRANLGKDQALALAGQMDFFGRLANGVHDQASYDDAKAQGQAQGFDTSHLPDEYSPDAVSAMQAQSMSAKDYIKQKWDITDDQIDNAEQKRHNEAEESDTRRGQDIRSGDTQRGQDQASADRRRGQDQESADRRRGQDQRGSGGHGGGGAPGRGLVRVTSIEQARALPPGTMFIDPQGNVRKR
jgi:hypothetical protein